MNDLSAFRVSASKMRSSERAFDGDFVSFKHDSGQWAAGKAKTDLSGRRLVADVNNLILGYQKYKDDKFVYAGHGFVRDGHQPPARQLLDERNEGRWKNNKDPWALTYYLSLFDPETREQFIYTTSSLGGKDALAVLQDAFADHNEGKAQYELPIVDLAGDSYVNQYDKTIFKPIFDIGGWCEAPPAFRAPKLPPSTAMPLTIEHKSSEEEASPGKPASIKPDGPDDEIPF
jgi:hypothetical protein